MNRKSFISNIIHLIFLGVFFVGSIYLGIRKKINVTGTCNADNLCEKCREFAYCELPKALKSKVNGKK